MREIGRSFFLNPNPELAKGEGALSPTKSFWVQSECCSVQYVEEGRDPLTRKKLGFGIAEKFLGWERGPCVLG
jgi:hypothetical protein